MDDFLKLLLSLSLSGTVAALVLLLLQRIFRNIVSKRWRYYAWLIVFARLLLPVTLPDSPIGHLFAERSAAVSAASADGSNLPVELISPADVAPSVTPLHPAAVSQPTKAPSAPAASAVSLSTALFSVWGIIALLLFTRKATQYQSFLRYLHAASVPVSDPALLNRYAEVCERVHALHPPELCISPLIATPMLVGIRKSYMILPSQLEACEMESIFLHELLHHTRGDALYKWFAQTVLCLHWFNPAVWFAVKSMELDCELACDEAVLGLLQPEDYSGYGDALLLATQTKSGFHTETAQLALSENAKQLKERLGTIMHYRKRTCLEKTFAVCLTFALCIGAGAVGAYAADAPRTATLLSQSPDAAASSSQNTTAQADASTPEATLELAIQAIKSLDIDALCRYSNNQKTAYDTLYSSPHTAMKWQKQTGPILFGGNSGKPLNRNLEIVRSLSWKMGKATVSGDTAKIELQLTNRDFGGVMAEIISQAFLESAADASSANSGSPGAVDDIDPLIAAVPDSKTVTLTVTANLQKIDGTWKLLIDDAFANAIFGNLFDGLDSPESQAKVDNASEKLGESLEKSLNEEWQNIREETQKEMDALTKNLEDMQMQIENSIDWEKMQAELEQALNDSLPKVGNVALVPK